MWERPDWIMSRMAVLLARPASVVMSRVLLFSARAAEVDAIFASQSMLARAAERWTPTKMSRPDLSWSAFVLLSSKDRASLR